MKINTLVFRFAAFILFCLVSYYSPRLLDAASPNAAAKHPLKFSLESTRSVSSPSTPDLSSILRGKKGAGDSSTAPSPSQQPIDNSFFYTLPSLPDPKEEIAANSSLIAQNGETETPDPSKSVLINFNNVSIIEYIRFVSRITNRNFVFDENDLQFNVTIISEEPATLENIMTALLQELRIHDLILIEDGNNFIIHRNPKVSGISKVVTDDLSTTPVTDADIITQVFSLNTLDPERAALIVRPLVSEAALVEVLPNSNHLIVTDLTSNVEKLAQLLKSIDAPNSGLVIGQYVSRLTPINTLIPIAQQIMQPISLDQTLSFVPHPATNSIFVIASPFLVERTISILQYLDQDQGATRILNLKDLRLGGTQINPRLREAENLRTATGEWMSDAQGNWIFKPELSPEEALLQQQRLQQGLPPEGTWFRDYEGQWNFNPGVGGGGPAPQGKWVLDKDGNWVYELDESFQPGPLTRQFQGGPLLPGGVEKKSQFFLYKLRYRIGESVEPVLRQIADTIQQNERGNEDLISALRSVQWLVGPNSLVFSGTPDALERVRHLLNEIDIPMRQVFIEMLILETSLADSLNFGVNYVTEFGGGHTSGQQAFLSGNTTLLGAMPSTEVTGLGGPFGNAQAIVPDGTSLAQISGFTLGIIGQKITHCGTEFGSIGALINALHDRTKDEVISNPKLLIEDNSTAEIFVGINTPYRTQSIANDLGSIVTSNFVYQDVGTRLRVTPYIGNGDIIAMDIEEEVSTIIAGLITNADTANTSPGPTTRIHRTNTRVHIPNHYFLIISGMMQDEESRERNQVPCLGGVPILGAGFSDKRNTSAKRNLMIFIRPQIIDTEEEVQQLTKHQQDIYDYKNCLKNSDEYEVVEALDLFNIKPTLHPEDEYPCECE
jgi:type III secretion protein C